MKMQHVTIQTNRFDEELNFYQDIVGLIIITDMRQFGRNMVFMADSENDTKIEIISPNPNVQFFFVKDPAGVNVQFMG